MSKEYYSHGKLLISGEYFVLEGSWAFAVPLKLGQSMIVNPLNHENNKLIWETTIKNEPWFQASFDVNNLEIIETTKIDQAIYLQNLLKHIKRSSKVLDASDLSVHIKTNLEFPIEWGFGSSSSLLSNLAYWADADPYQMLFETTEASGYDIACARSENPILYQLAGEPIVQNIKFDPDFLSSIYFVYLGKKQDSFKSIKQYRNRIQGKKKETERISEITKSLVQSKTLDEFNEYITEHEYIVSEAIGRPTIKTEYFNDFLGTIKSLGAWGGDFIMATHGSDGDYVRDYFKSKGLHIIFPYRDLVL